MSTTPTAATISACASVALLWATACASHVPTARVVAGLNGRDFQPLAAGGGFVVTGSPLTAWRREQPEFRRVRSERPAAIAVAGDGRACATVAVRPALGLHAYRLPGLEPIAAASACNDLVSLSLDAQRVACVERRQAGEGVEASVRVFSFPGLQPIRSLGPFVHSVEKVTFVDAAGERVAALFTDADPAQPKDPYVSRLVIFDTSSGAQVSDFGQRGRFDQLVFGPTGDAFYWAGQPGVQHWSLLAHTHIKDFASADHTISLALSPDGKLLATSQREHPLSPGFTEGGGAIQVFDVVNGERVAAFGSAELRDAVREHESTEMISDRSHFHVELQVLGAAPDAGPPVLGDLFGSSTHVANYPFLAFVDSATLVSGSRGFFAFWPLQELDVRVKQKQH